jgi:hypothetical protein
MTSESTPFRYDAFLSYSTGSDYGLAALLEELVEGFHEQPGLKEHGLPPLRICRDGSDFRLPARMAGSSGVEQAAIHDVIRPYLEASRALVILWPGRAAATPFMDWELEEFLAQNARLGSNRRVLLAVTHGFPQSAPAAEFFSDRQVSARLHEAIYFDLRGRYPESATWTKVRDFEAECFRLAVELCDPRDARGERLAIGDLLPTWVRAREARRQRDAELTRKALARKAAVASRLVADSPMTALALAADVFRAVDCHESRKALADVLLAQSSLRGHLQRRDAHTGAVEDIAFLGSTRLLSLDAGTGAINDERRGALCIWDVASGGLVKRDDRCGGARVVGIDDDRVVIAAGQSLIALRWFEDQERFGFRKRWDYGAPFARGVRHLVHEPTDDLLAAAGGNRVVLLRDGDRALIADLEADGEVRGLSWLAPKKLALALEASVAVFALEGGLGPEVRTGAPIRDCIGDPSGLLVLLDDRVLVIRDGAIAGEHLLPRDFSAWTIRRAGRRLLVADGRGDNHPGARLLAIDPDAGGAEVLYEDYRHMIHRIAVSPDGRHVAGAKLDRTGDSTTRCVPLWNVASWAPLPVRVLDVDADFSLARELPGSDGFALVRGNTLSAHAPDGAERWRRVLDEEIAQLAPCRSLRAFAVATKSASVLLLSTEDGATMHATSPGSGGDALVSLTAVLGGRRLICGFASGRVSLLGAEDLSLIATARRRRHDLLGNVTEAAPEPGVTAKGGAAWLDTPWVLLHPSNEIALSSASHPRDDAGVVRVTPQHPLVCGWGWWDTRTDAITWSLTGSLGMGEAPLVGLDRGAVVSPSPERDLSVAVYTLERGSGDSLSPPEAAVSMLYDLPDGLIALLSDGSGALVAAQTWRELSLLAPEEAEPIARVPVPDDFRALTFTGDGAAIIARVEGKVVALSVLPERWAGEARRKAGRDLTESERRRYLADIPAAKASISPDPR